MNFGCSDIEEEQVLHDGDSFRNNPTPDLTNPWMLRKVKCLPTSTILSRCNAPKHIDLISIDTEGYSLKTLRGINFNQIVPQKL